MPEVGLENMTYTPNTNYTGTDSFGWTGYDGTYYASNSASVNITVQQVGQNPTVSSFNKTVNENAAMSFTASDFTSHFSDPNAGLSLSLVGITQTPSYGTLAFNGTAVVTVIGYLWRHLENLTYTPNANYTGTDTFGWTGYDGTYLASNSASVNITVNNAANNTWGPLLRFPRGTRPGRLTARRRLEPVLPIRSRVPTP